VTVASTFLGIHAAYWNATALKLVLGVGLALLGAGTFVYVFLFKMVSHLQSRLGPMESGPHGSLQLMAEVLKFTQKEDVFPEKADRWVFGGAPFLVIMSTLMVFVVIPIGPRGVASNLDVGILYALAVSSISVIGVLMAGWASANKYSLMGALRGAGQLIAYELPLVLAVVGVVMQAGSLNLQQIVASQARFKLFGFQGLGLFAIPQLAGLFIFLVSAQAELTQTPFDMPVAESELVAGYLTEYTGLRFLIFFIAEFATAFALAGRGAHVLVGGRNAARAEAVVTSLRARGAKADFIDVDLGSSDSARELARRATELGGGHVDILVNNAAIFPTGPTAAMAENDIDAAFAVNVKVPFVLVGELAPAMASRGKGAIVNVGTMVAEFGMAGTSLYGASKAALVLLTKAWAAEFGPSGVRVNAVNPGPTRTEGTAVLGEAIDKFAALAPAGRPASPDEIAAAITYLASDDASFVHGAILAVDGGRTAA